MISRTAHLRFAALFWFWRWFRLRNSCCVVRSSAHIAGGRALGGVYHVADRLQED